MNQDFVCLENVDHQIYTGDLVFVMPLFHFSVLNTCTFHPLYFAFACALQFSFKETIEFFYQVFYTKMKGSVLYSSIFFTLTLPIYYLVCVRFTDTLKDSVENISFYNHSSNRYVLMLLNFVIICMTFTFSVIKTLLLTLLLLPLSQLQRSWQTFLTCMYNTVL